MVMKGYITTVSSDSFIIKRPQSQIQAAYSCGRRAEVIENNPFICCYYMFASLHYSIQLKFTGSHGNYFYYFIIYLV